MNLTWLPLLFYPILGGVLHRTMGFYDAQVVVPLTVLFLITGGVMLRHTGAVPERWLGVALASTVVLFTALLVDHQHLNVVNRSIYALVQQALRAALAVSVIVVIGACLTRARAMTRAALWIVGALLVMAQVAVPVVSPTPPIDVFHSNTAAVDYFLRGLNPYAQSYRDIYGGRYDYLPGFLYFPGTLYWLMPARVLLRDIRYSLVLANVASAFGFYWLARGRTSNPLTPWLFAVAWLSFPLVLFVLDNAWTDTALVTMAVLGFLAIDRRAFWAAAIVGGFAMAFKQYAFVIPGVLLLHVWNTAGVTAAIRFTAVAAATFVVVFGPFAIWDWANLYRFTIENQLAPGMRPDALNFTAHLHNAWGIVVPKVAGAALTVVAIVGGLALVFFGHVGLSSSAAALFIAYGISFVFGKWAFANYYFLLAGLLLLYLVGTIGPDPAPSRGPGDRA